MMINTIPQHNLGVRLSPKIVTPKNTAVTGSKAPRIAVGVEPMYCTACVVQRKDIAVGKIANAIRFPHKYHLSTTFRLCPKSTRTKIQTDYINGKTEQQGIKGQLGR